MTINCKDKVCLVTGAAAGIGAASCRALAEAGAKIVVSDINVEAGTALTESLVAEGSEAIFVAMNVCDEPQWQGAIAQITGYFGRLDVLVNNAGIANICGIEEETLEGWRKTQEINSDAVFLGAKAAISAMKAQGGGIINISSIEGIVGDPMLPAYNASKGAVRALTKSLALYCADNEYGIRVNSVHPGYVATPLVSGALARLDASDAEEFATRVVSSIPLKRMAEPEEIAQAIVFLASDASSYMTGSELVIDGGYTAR